MRSYNFSFSFWIINLFVFSIAHFYFQEQILTSIGISIFSSSILLLTYFQVEIIPVRAIILFFSSLQWCIAPILFYNGYYDHYKYYMYVPEIEYMELSVWSLIALSVGLYIVPLRSEKNKILCAIEMIKVLLNKDKKLPFIFISVGIVISFISSFLPSSLGFVWFLLGNLSYAGIILLMYSEIKFRFEISFLAMVITFAGAASKGLFHDFFLWAIFVGLFYVQIKNTAGTKKLIALICSIFLLAIVQTVKFDYRNATWYGNQEASAFLFMDLVYKRIFDEKSEQDIIDVEGVSIRLNQGWIISRIMETVPASVAFLDGSTVWIAIKASILPRFLFPDKPIAGGKKNFEKITKYKLNRTSMGISLLGEGYANFGKVGAYFFLFICGVVISMILYLLVRISLTYPILITFIPIIFFHVVKAESELLVILNFLFKSLILFVLLSTFYKRISTTKSEISVT